MNSVIEKVEDVIQDAQDTQDDMAAEFERKESELMNQNKQLQHENYKLQLRLEKTECDLALERDNLRVLALKMNRLHRRDRDTADMQRKHLVKANQSHEDFSADEYDETQSVMEVNKDSIGKLLHEMITIYTICGDTIRVLLHSTPDAARVEDNFGRLPLHVAVDRDKPWMFAIEHLMHAYPEALNRRDSGGRLPLHIAVDRQEPSVDLVRLLLSRYPTAASARRGVGRLPLHYAVFAEKPSLEVLQCLLAAFPEGASTADVYGRLPLHYAVDKAVPDTAVIKYLLEVYPEGASVRDTHMRLPLTICIDRDHINLKVVKMLCAAYPPGLSEWGPADKLPLHVLVEAPSPQFQVVSFAALQYPEAVTMGSKYNKQQETPIAIALSRDDNQVKRCLLLVAPSTDPQLLRRLNWEARRVAFLLIKATTRRASAVERMAQFTLGMVSGGTPKSSFTHQQAVRGEHSPPPTRLSNNTIQSARKKSSSAVSVSELLLHLPGLIMPGGSNSPSHGHEVSLSARGDDKSQRPSGLSVMSSDEFNSPCVSPKGTFTSTPHRRQAQQINFYLRLYVTNPELFRLAVMYL
eukprot:gene24579-30945_t